MTHELLQPAIRQYRHNNEDSFVFGYDQKVTDRIVAKLLAEVEQWKQVAEDAAVAATRTEACEIVEAALTFAKGDKDPIPPKSDTPVRHAVITCRDTQERHLIDEYAVARFLVSKGFKSTGGPIMPKLSGIITMTQDMIDGSYHYEQRDA